MNSSTPKIENSIKYVIFDFDGVVADTESVFATFDQELLNNVLDTAGIQERLTIEDTRALSGQSGETKLRTIAKRYKFDASQYIDGFTKNRTEKRKTLFIENPAPLGQNLNELLGLIKGRSALATNKTSHKFDLDTKIMGLSDLFDKVVTCDPPLRGKPETDLLIAAAFKLGAEPYECAYIGDNVNDMIAAKKAGMLPIGFVIEGKESAPERAQNLIDNGAHNVIDDFLDIKPYLSL